MESIVAFIVLQQRLRALRAFKRTSGSGIKFHGF